MNQPLDSYQFEVLERQRIRLDSEIARRLDYIDRIISSPVSEISADDELDGLERAFSELLYVCDKLRPLVADPTDFESWLKNVEKGVFLAKKSVLEAQIPFDKVSDFSSVSRSRSNKSSSSSSSSTKSRFLNEATDLAALEVELEFAKRKGLSENEIILLEEKIAKKKAVLNVYESWSSKNFYVEENLDPVKPFSSTPFSSAPQKPSQKVTFLPTPPSTPKIRPSRKLLSSKGSIKSESVVSDFNSRPNGDQSENLSNALFDLVQMQGAPSVSLEVFDGDPLNYIFFMTNFEDNVEKRISDSKGRLARLLNFTSGEANDLIQCCVYRVGDSYEYAKSLLKRKYGDPHRIMIAYRKQLQSWEIIKPGDSSAFGKFHSFLLKCGSLIKSHLWNSFDTADNLCVIASKLPSNCRDKWNRKVIDIRKKFLREPSFNDLLLFVENEVTVASDPLFSREALQDRFPNDKKIKSFLCLTCNDNHDLENCSIFKEKDLTERHKFLLKNRLCFACLEKGHISSYCKSRKVCKICAEYHPTSLHGLDLDCFKVRSPNGQSETDQKVVKRSVNCGLNIDTSRFGMTLCVLPVVLRHRDANSDVITYALIDNCSQVSFITEEVLAIMSIPSDMNLLTVNTINSCRTENCQVVSGLNVKGCHGSDGTWISLPNCYSKNQIPVDRENIPNIQSIQRWNHLKSILPELPKTNFGTASKVELIIGADCPEALTPIKIIQSENNGPYAFKTKLGWCVVGPRSNDDKQTTTEE